MHTGAFTGAPCGVLTTILGRPAAIRPAFCPVVRDRRRGLPHRRCCLPNRGALHNHCLDHACARWWLRLLKLRRRLKVLTLKLTANVDTVGTVGTVDTNVGTNVGTYNVGALRYDVFQCTYLQRTLEQRLESAQLVHKG